MRGKFAEKLLNINAGLEKIKLAERKAYNDETGGIL
jgi:hypothetical protein